MSKSERKKEKNEFKKGDKILIKAEVVSIVNGNILAQFPAPEGVDSYDIIIKNRGRVIRIKNLPVKAIKRVKKITKIRKRKVKG